MNEANGKSKKLVQDWTNEEVVEWLKIHSFHELIPSFQKHKITGESLLDLSKEDLKEIGLETLNDRIVLWKRIQELKQENTPDFRQILELMEGFRRSKVLFTAVKLCIFDFLLEKTASTLDEMAKSLQLDHDGLERLLDACTSLELLEKTGEHYRLTPISEKYLVKKSPISLVGYIFHSNEFLYKLWEHLEVSVKGGANYSKITQQKEMWSVIYSNQEAMERFMEGMHSFSSLSADKIVSSFDLSPYAHIVDLGGATGALVTAACIQYSNLQGTIVDFENVLVKTKEYLGKLDERVRKRIQLKSVDFFSGELPKGDIYVLSRILHDWDITKIDLLLTRIHDVLPENGAVLIAEMLVNDDKLGPCSALLQSLNMLVQTDGKERSFLEYKDILERNGFHNCQFKRTGTPLDVILATKKASVQFIPIFMS